jgi:hypothetical protein
MLLIAHVVPVAVVVQVLPAETLAQIQMEQAALEQYHPYQVQALLTLEAEAEAVIQVMAAPVAQAEAEPVLIQQMEQELLVLQIQVVVVVVEVVARLRVDRGQPAAPVS